MTKISAVLLVVGLVIGIGMGYGIGFISYQPEISRLQTNLSTAQSEIDSLETQVSSLKSERSDLEVQVSNLMSNRSDLEVQVSNLMSNLMSTQQQASNLMSNLKSTQQQVSNLMSNLKSTQQQASNLMWEVSDLRSDLENTLGTITTLKTIISAMINQSAVTPAYIRLYDEKLGFGFEYPEDWETHVEDGPFPDKDIKKVVTCNLDIYGVYGAVYPFVCVQIELKIKSTNFTDLKYIKEELRKELNMSGLPILNESTIVVNNREGYDLLAGISYNHIFLSSWKLRQVVFLADGMVYMFKYSSQEEFYRIYEETFDYVINSFIIE